MVKEFCIVENGKVVNRAVAKTPLAENWLEIDAAIGDSYIDGRVAKAEVPVIKPAQDKFSALVNLLTEKGVITTEDANTVTRVSK